MAKAKKLTEQQKELAKNLACGMSEVKAYIQAGYNAKWAQGNAHTRIKELMKKNDVFKNYYDSLLAPQEGRRRKTVEDIHAMWADMMDDLNLSPEVRLRASENAARAFGMFINQQKVELSGGLPVFLKDDVNE